MKFILSLIFKDHRVNRPPSAFFLLTLLIIDVPEFAKENQRSVVINTLSPEFSLW